MQPWTPCVETSRVVGDRFKTPWGITLGDVQKAALGSHRTPLTWRRDEEVSYGAEGTRTTLLVEITRRGAATFVERSGAMRSDLGLVAYDCSSVLLMPVHVKVMTQDGVFSSEGDSELAVRSRSSIVLTLYAAQRGTLQIRTRDKGTVVDSLGIVLGFRRERTMVGAIGGGYKCPDEGCMHIAYAFACFPDSRPFRLDEFMFGACGE